MLSTVFGTAAFVLFFLYDINSFRWKRRLPRRFFLLGSLLLAASAALDFRKALKSGELCGGLDMLLLALCALSLGLLLYSLFFARPFSQTYTAQQEDRPVCRHGVYALCRHPGILWFLAAYLFAGLAAPDAFAQNGILLSVLNLCYAFFQDRVTFMKTFTDYAAYRGCVPFLIPTKDSIRMAVKTLRRTDAKEDIP